MSRFVVRNLRVLAMIAFIAAWGIRLATSGLLWSDDDSRLLPSRPTAESPVTPGTLLAAHDCWSKHAPADMRHQVPGHVVVTTSAGRTVYGGTRLVGRALDQEFAHTSAGLTVWGFCR